MKSNQGIQRINTVFWGVLGLCAVVVFCFGVFITLTDRSGIDVCLGATVCAVAAFVAHRVSRWAINAFFSA